MPTWFPGRAVFDRGLCVSYALDATAVRTRLAAFAVPPRLVLDAGETVTALWLLSGPVADLEHLKLVGHRLAIRVGGDPHEADPLRATAPWPGQVHPRIFPRTSSASRSCTRSASSSRSSSARWRERRPMAMLAVLCTAFAAICLLILITRRERKPRPTPLAPSTKDDDASLIVDETQELLDQGITGHVITNVRCPAKD